MRQYALYENTGIVWNPQKPTHWKKWRGKRFFYSPKIKNIGNTEKNILSLTLKGVIRNNADRPIGLSPSDYSTYQIFEKNDLVFKLIDLNNISTSRVGLVPERGIMSSAYIRLTARHDCNIRYFYFQYYDLWLRNIYNGLGAGVRQTLSAEDLLNLEIVIPSREEQDQIVHFLDWKISEINRLINIKHKEIATLEELKQSRLLAIVTRGLDENVEMVDSEIEHIGLVPKHWKVLLNHRIYRENSRPFSGDETVLSLSQKDGLLPYVDMKERSLHTSSYENWKLVFPNDLVLNRFKAHLGVFFSSNYRGIVTFHYGVYEPVMKLSSKYYELLYHTPKYKQVFAGASNGMTVGLQNLSNTNFYKVYTVYPPYDEQCTIVKEAEKIEKEIQAIIATVSSEIERLHEFRTRLIADVVTGKIDVRGIEIPEYEYTAEEADSDSEAEAEDLDEGGEEI